MRLSIVIIGAALSLQGAYAWGAAGHQIVATVAQIYLQPNVLPILCNILDLQPNKCHLSSVASWADQHRNRMRWSGPMHYIGAVDDHPSQTCAFPGEHKWAGHQGINALDAIRNTTSLLQAWVNNDVSDAVASEALKFLIHFVGDMHQPLHLTGRDRGGNSVRVLFDRRHTNLHSVWDTLLVAKAIRTVPRNYSRPLPYRRIEHTLQGTIYDPYIRRIMFEGVLDSWKSELSDWLACPIPPSSTSSMEVESAASTSMFLGLWKSTFTTTRRILQTFMSKLNPKMGVDILPDGPVVCPYAWAKPNHQLNCDIIWPPELDDDRYLVTSDFQAGDEPGNKDEEQSYDDGEDTLDHSDAANTNLLQLDTPKYAGAIAHRMIIEKLLAQGGIRLAGILNYIFAPPDDDQNRDERGLFIVG